MEASLLCFQKQFFFVNAEFLGLWVQAIDCLSDVLKGMEDLDSSLSKL